MVADGVAAVGVVVATGVADGVAAVVADGVAAVIADGVAAVVAVLQKRTCWCFETKVERVHFVSVLQKTWLCGCAVCLR